MQLSQLNQFLEHPIAKNQQDITINKFHINSKEVESGDLFFPQKGYHYDSHNDILDLLKKKAFVLFYSSPHIPKNIPDQYHSQVILINKNFDGHVQKLLAQISKAFFNSPDSQMKIVGITGTNGKTSTTYLAKSILEQEKSNKVGLIGSIAYLIGSEHFKATNTTPDAYNLYKILAQMRDAHCNIVLMEISSHALELQRCFLLDLNIAVFTNITQDHLDFHKTMEHYFYSKLHIFNILNQSKKNTKTAIFNQQIQEKNKIESLLKQFDIPYTVVDQQKNQQDYPFFIYGKTEAMNINFTRIQIYINEEKPFTIETNNLGSFNVDNTLMAIAIAKDLDINQKNIIEGLKNVQIKGRFENITPSLPYSVIIDFGHTPDALQKVLQTTRFLKPRRVILVFGCGGDRDQSKRPLMGNIATQYADTTIITSDNPRTEDPKKIIESIVDGIKPIYNYDQDYFIEVDRQKAIIKALSMAKKEDIIIIAGKGHEEYQVIKDSITEFSDKKVVLQYLNQ